MNISLRMPWSSTVPKERIVTPFDLIDKSGKMKEPK